MAKAILVDTTRCVGCRACMNACKKWNELKHEITYLNYEAKTAHTNPKTLSPKTWTTVRFVEIGPVVRWPTGSMQTNPPKWIFAKQQCMHCVDPACARVCPAKAITKYVEGPVVIDESKCTGCKECIAVCPFEIPKYDAARDKVYKCWMCADRVVQGLAPACVSTCPTGALDFGDLDVISAKANERKEKVGGYIYGKTEAGGTSVYHVSDVPPTELGFPEVAPYVPLQVQFKDWFMKPFSAVTAAIVVGLAAVMALVTRRSKVKGFEKAAQS